MPNDDKDVATTIILTFEQKCKELQAEVDALKKEAGDSAQELAGASKKIKLLEEQLKKQKSAVPTGDCVIFEGKTYEIKGHFRADNTFVEVKRGHCDEGCTLIAIARPH